jgi:hypothetical protein
MAKTIVSNPVFQRKTASEPGTDSFNLVPQINPFSSIFDLQSLDDKTAQAIELLVHDLNPPETDNIEALRADIVRLKNITVEVQAIEKQGVLLVGERLFKAREILGRWSQGSDSFRNWLNIVFKHRSSAYNVLAFYDLHQILPSPELQKKLKEMPHKAAYVLAARKGEIEAKAEIVEKHFHLKADEIIAIVQDKFPSSKKESKQSVPDALIDTIRTGLRKLIAKRHSLKKGHFTAIAECQNLIEVLLAETQDEKPSIEISPT